MDEDNSAKAPVTRLRRRLSVESTDEKSSTPNTPSKKRGRPPKLDQIDENDVTPQKPTPKRVTRRTAKDTLEPVEEKALTPVRRSTRIKSNTSIVSDTALTTAGDTPRAKRVTRRNSQLGSDSETPLTPAKQTRRTRKDSTPKLDKDKSIPQITEVIAEEPELEKGLTTPSHSPLNKNKKENSGIVIEEEKKADISANEDSNKKNHSLVTDSLSPDIQKENISPGPKHNKRGNLSASTIDLLNNVDKSAKTDVLNKTTSYIESNMKPYKKRTKSWSTMTSIASDSPKKQLKDVTMNKSETKSDSDVATPKSQNLKSVKVVVDKMDLDQIPKESSTQNKDLSSEDLFNKDPTEVSKPEIIIEELNSEKDIQKAQDSEDQFVPVVDVASQNVDVSHGEKIFNDSVEPMDIDQTIPESMGLLEEKESFIQTESNNKSRKSSLSESKRKSSISLAMETENKSTLIISQLNENASQTNILAKSKMPSDNTSIISKSLIDMDKSQNIDKEQKNLSITCLTSTPLQQKPLQRLVAPVNTSIIKSNDNIQSTHKTPVDINSPLVNKSTDKNQYTDLYSPSKNLRFDQDGDENVAKDETNKTNQSVNSGNDSKKKCNDAVKNIVSNNKSNISSPKYKNSENNMSSQSNKSKESKLRMEVDSSDEESSDDMSNLKHNESKNKSRNTDNTVSDASDDSDTSHDESNTKNELVNDEADDAGDDYESGDSQDEEELRYAKENEIIDKGVTLTSDEDFSNDSDYEKDSFIVSSDEGDNELLEGTEDDLSMSDNELKMTAKSKKKYNERMIKEQKKASKEMYESRHKLNIKKRNVINDDTESESDDNNAPKQQKKTNRMRLDSSHETSVLNETSRTENTKRLSESSVKETINEKEMTQMDISSQEKDPLATSMKKEPKSPKENANTTLDFISIQCGPQPSVNSSQLNNTNKGTTDPVESEKEDDSSSDSDTNNIISNYDSILSTLNKADLKKFDTSLNIDVKKKVKGKRASIIDELNLTQSGKEEKGRTPKTIEVEGDSSSSDSINLKLLISEDSNTDSINTKNEDEAIPLKPSEAKTDLTNKKDEKMDCGSEDIFFIDTQGSLDEDAPTEEKIIKEDISNIKTPKSDKKKKQKFTESQTDINDAPTEEKIIKDNNSNIKTPKSDKKKQKLTKSQTDINDTLIEENITSNLNSSSAKTPKSDKKKKQNKSSSIADIEDAPIEEKIQKHDTSNIKTPKSEKKKKNTVSESQVEVDVELTEENVTNISTTKTPKSDKKKKKLSESQADDAPEENIVKDQNTSFKSPSEKKKERLSISQLNIETMQETIADQHSSNLKTPKSDKKKKQKLSESQADLDVSELNLSKAKTPKSDKKKKDVSELQGNIQELDSSNAKTPKSAKKKKISLSESQTNIQELNLSNIKTPQSDKKKNQELGPKANTPKSDKKKKQAISQQNDENVTGEISVMKTPQSAEKTSDPQIDINIQESEEKQEDNLLKSKRRKKNKKELLESADIVDGQSDDLEIGKKKRKRSLTVPVEEIIGAVYKNNGNEKKKMKVIDTEETVKATDVKKRKKRKEREDDEHDQPKVQPSSSKMLVPRLPMSVISQLDDNPNIQAKKKPKVISTSQFIVEDYRRKMPSKYLEESVYLNDDSPEKKKPKKNIPKVLPSMPSSTSSNHGFTTTFKINVLSAETNFVAKSDSVANFKEDRLYNKIQKRRTNDHFKRQRSSKLTKF